MSNIIFYIDTVCEDISDFDSKHHVFNEYMQYSGDSAVIHYIMDAETDKLIAYFSVLTSALLYGDPKNLNAIPAIELKMFALDKRYQGLNLSSILLDAIIKTIRYYSDQYVGADILILYSVPVDHVIELYESKGFQQVEGTLTAFRSDFTVDCVPMFLTL